MSKSTVHAVVMRVLDTLQEFTPRVRGSLKLTNLLSWEEK